jgi:6-phosphogluconate dehydrogenase
MQLGMIGLVRMGSYMVQRLMKAGHNCVAFDTHPEAMQELVNKGPTSAGTLPEFVKKLTKRTAPIWLMVPAAADDSVLSSLKPLLQA